ncbi:MAG: hypothetical protein ACYS3S_06125 [Planctomycetota bacterium]|jgi:hypothetical protein
MATTAQILANRLNSRKSTGPKTGEGKSAVSQNAVKHGIFAQSVIKGENEADYEAFHDNLLTELKPVGVVETMLAERFVSLSWRLQRAERMQNQVFDVTIARDEPSPLSKRMHDILPKDLQEIDYDTRAAGPELVLGRSVIRDFANARVLDRLMLYERRIENSQHKTLRELERRQLIRQFQQQEAEQELNPSPSLRDEAATQKKQNADLKKQSQYASGLIGAKPFMKGDYDKSPDVGNDENKAKQSQFDAPFSTEEVVKRDRPFSGAGSSNR